MGSRIHSGVSGGGAILQKAVRRRGDGLRDRVLLTAGGDISDEVWECYGKNWSQWAAVLDRIYFPSPGDAMNLFAGVILVLCSDGAADVLHRRLSPDVPSSASQISDDCSSKMNTLRVRILRTK